ncbi:Gfo/Idh/MocA family protein [Nesterenkonia xinjiangensis]|uniref:Myo-inositol 2-dehydrogenase/D-chiro-inositol 1-dehydrogenase n=1 Tax=Nesterenkonia xinjiangensis TaxID=225327 RepID=A0A7Z0GMM0_9MICC|nr:Gfo/Idh/MocA family oxidoreductase [Nesterenkonia xinjiangensis]NYJ78776.1 myo-inositol 2-dehydrogenase/D-chiro-inositol 1-dehydrogenase [Nesterenkonia xinjiangensis]
MTTVLGLIGVGRIGVMHARTIQALADDGVELILADVDVARARQVSAELGCRVAEDVDALFAAAPDGVVIAVGTPQHAPLILRAAQAGIPAFCEKPVAESTEASVAVLEAIARHGATVQIGHQRRLDPGHLAARQALQRGELGWLHTIRAITADMAPPSVEFLATSGGLFRDCSVHDFDSIQWLTGQRIVEVYARGSNNGDPAIGGVGDVDTAVALATLEDGTVATVSATRYNGGGHDVRLELQGSAGTVQVGLDDSYAGRSAELGVDFPAGPAHQTFHERFAEAYHHEMRAFLELVRGQRENPCPPGEAVDASRVADAAQESLETGRPVRVRR